MVRLGQNFLTDPNLLDAIVRDSGVGPTDCVLEIGPGEGVLTERLAAVARQVEAIELDRSLEPELARVASLGNVDLIFGDAVGFDYAALEPPPNVMVANLPYSVATPVIIETMTALPGMERWTVMVQKEIAERLVAEPGTRAYGSPSAVIRQAASVRVIRKVGRQVFRPQPRVDSAIISIERNSPGPSPDLIRFVRAAFAHRRKSLARSVELVFPGTLDRARSALSDLGLDPGLRAEAISPGELAELSGMIGELGKGS